MKTSIAALASFLLLSPALTTQDGHEQPPILKASEILRPEILAGPRHKVREPVPTWSGANRFAIDSDFGAFEADGNSLVETRVAEIAAIDKLKQISRSDEYKKALERAAKAPVDFAENLVKEPAKTVAAVPKGAWKFLSRVGEGVKDAVEGKGGKAEDTAKSAIGVDAAKRELAVELGVDPYSSNQVLQAELQSVAWASVSGATTIKLLMLPLGGGIVTAAKVASTGSEMQQILKESSPADLRKSGSEKLVAMGVPTDTIEAFFSNPAISPTHKMVLVLALGRLEGVKGRADFVRAAAEGAEDEQDAIFWGLTARMLADLHARGPKLDRIKLLDGFPVGLAADGTVVVALHWDYACWTPLADRFARAVQALGTGAKPAFLLALSGVVSPRLRKELESRGFRVQDRLVPGPLK